MVLQVELRWLQSGAGRRKWLRMSPPLDYCAFTSLYHRTAGAFLMGTNGLAIGLAGDGGRSFPIFSEQVKKLHRLTLGGKAGWPSTGFTALAMALAVAEHVGAPPPTVCTRARCSLPSLC